MRALLVNMAAEWGGGEGWTLRTLLGLTARGHATMLAARKGSPLAERARAAGVELREMEVGVDYHLGSIREFVRMIRSFRADVLLVHHNKDVRTAGVAAKLIGCPVVHRNGFPILQNTFRHRISLFFVDRILTNSERIRERYLEYGWVRKPIDIIPNGVALPEGEVLDDAVRNSFFAEGGLLALYAGRLTAVKSVDTLLHAFAELPESSRWRLLVAGEGSERVRLQQLTQELGLDQRIRFAGFIEQAAVLAGMADIVLLPSKEEGMPNALMEAMVRGVPVVATPVGDVPFLLDDGRAGWLIETHEPAVWTALLQRLEANPEERQTMGEAGRQRILQRFGFEAMMDGVEGCLQGAAAKV